MFIRYFRLNSLKSIQQRLVHFEKNQTNTMEKQGNFNIFQVIPQKIFGATELGGGALNVISRPK
jgi:hypothetical protein